MRVDVTLRGDDARWFEQVREKIAEERNGNKPSRAETLRLLMQYSDY